MELYTENIQRYFDFCKERHAIYLRRQRGDEWPWTIDPILKTYRFTNCYRELDTGTIWLREHIREPYADDKELFFNIAAYRLFNWIPTYRNLGYIYTWNRDWINSILRKMRANGENVFTNAHMMTGTLGGDKIHQFVDIILPKLWENRQDLQPMEGDTLQDAFIRLCKHSPGFGAFISYEVVTDLQHTRYLENATDIMTWANPGPGAMRGIQHLLGLPVGNMKGIKCPSYDKYIEHMQNLLSMSKKYLPKWMPAWEMREIEHTLCEFSKYEKVRLGGRSKRKYYPPEM